MAQVIPYSPALAGPIRGATVSRASGLVVLMGKSMLAAADQALFSGANFLLNVLLARWVNPVEYGAYSVAYAMFLLFSSMHGALLAEPMMVFGSTKYSSRFRSYMKLLVRGNFALSIPLSLLLSLAAAALGRFHAPRVSWALGGLAAASPAILLFWLARRMPYVILQPRWSVVAGACYLPLVLGLAALLKVTGHVGTFAAFLAMGIASLVASLLFLPRFLRTMADSGSPAAREVAHDHWRYGRWAAATSVVQWFPGQVYYALLPAWLGLEGAAGLRALMNFAMPVTQAISALTMLLLPMLARDRAAGPASMNRTMLRFLAMFGGGSLLYLILLWLLRAHVFIWFYGGRYTQYLGWPLTLTGLLPFGTCITAVLGNGLRALERPDLMLWCSVGSVVSTLLLGIPLAAHGGVGGALAGLQISSLVSIILMFVLYRRCLREFR
jgi:O-antigen/teichoic acid export membrane protein